MVVFSECSELKSERCELAWKIHNNRWLPNCYRSFLLSISVREHIFHEKATKTQRKSKNLKCRLANGKWNNGNPYCRILEIANSPIISIQKQWQKMTKRRRKTNKTRVAGSHWIPDRHCRFWCFDDCWENDVEVNIIYLLFTKYIIYKSKRVFQKRSFKSGLIDPFVSPSSE